MLKVSGSTTVIPNIGILINFKRKISKSMSYLRPQKLKFKGFDLNVSSFFFF